MLPNKLKNYNVFLDGVGYAGKTKDATAPSLTLITEAYRGGGMDAPIDIDMGMEQPMTEITFSEYVPEVIALFGNDRQVALRGAMEGPDGVIPVLIQCQGKTTVSDMGQWTPGGDSEHKITIKLTQYKLTINGQLLVEIDIDNMKRIINGVDQLAGQRAALGI